MSDDLIPLSDVVAPAAAASVAPAAAAPAASAGERAPTAEEHAANVAAEAARSAPSGTAPTLTPADAAPAPTPSIIPLSDVTPPAAAAPAATALAPEQSYTFKGLGPLNGPANALQGFTEQANRAATMGLSDKISALADASGPIIKGIADSVGSNWLAMHPDVSMPPDQTAPPPSVSDAYHAALDQQRAIGDAYAANHPVASKVASTFGTIADVPLTAGGIGSVLGGGAAAASKVAPTLGGRMLQGAGQGAGIGALTGFGNSNDRSPLATAVDTGEGAGFGALAGGAAPVVAEHVIQPAINWIARRFGPAAATSQGVQQIADRMRQSASAGGPSAQDILDMGNAANAAGKPWMVADFAGQPVKGIGERVANAPGPGQEFATNALTQRNLGEGSRLESDINAGISGGASHYSAVKALEDSRAAAAGPLYDAAYSHPGNKAMVSPMIDRVLETPAGKRALAAARVKMQNDMSLMGKPDAELGAMARAQGIEGTGGVATGLSLRSLDYVKRAMDDQIGVAMRAGEKDEARILIGLKNKLLSAIDEADATRPKLRGMLQQFREQPPGKYAQARAAYSGPSKTAEAVNEGALIFKKHPDQIREEIVNLSPGDREFYKLGAASALRDQIASKGTTGDESKLLVNSRLAQSRIRPIFDDEASFQRFMRSFETENAMHRTYAETLGSSRTARRVAESSEHASGAIGHLGRAGLAAIEGAHGAAGLSLFSALRALGGNGNPDVNLAIAKALYSTDHAANSGLLQRLMAVRNAPSMVPSAAVPVASLSASGLTGLLHGYKER